jgi:hypothetical protein
LKSDTSRSAKPGPANVPRPSVPQVPAAGKTNAFGLNH